MSELCDVWAEAAVYESYIGRWSRPVAREFLKWLAPEPRLRWIDVGCGSGALTATILREADPASIHALDASEPYVSYARKTIVDARTQFDVADARALPDPSESVDQVVSGLMLNFVPQPERAAREMARVARPGGVVAIYLWDYAGEMQLIRHFWDAAVALDPAARALDEAQRFPLCHPERLAELWQSVGLDSVETRAIDVATVFRDFDDYWQPFLGGQGPAPGYAMALDEARRSALREALRARLPRNSAGNIQLIARAWAVRGTK